MNNIRKRIEIFDSLFIKMRGVIKEISKSKIKNKMVNIKKLIENGIFRMVFSLNPHSKFMFIMLCFLVMLKFINKVIINIKFKIINIMIMMFVKFINFLSF